jgi:hypothetical protein
MWMPFNPQAWADYAEHFARWTVAYLPAFAALLVGSDFPTPPDLRANRR